MFALIAWLAAMVLLLLENLKIHALLSKQWLGWLLIGIGLLKAYNSLFTRGFTLYPAQYFSSHHMLQFIMGIITLLFGIYWLTTDLPDTIRKYFTNANVSNITPLFLPVFIAVLDLPLQFLMISLSGNNFGHYYMSAFPSITVLCAFFFWSLFSNPNRYQAVILTIILAIPVFIFGINKITEKTRINENKTIKAVATYVQSKTQPDDPVFFWSNTVPTYLESERLSPSIFYFTDPLFLKGYTNRQHTEPFLTQLQAAPPKIIIATPNKTQPLLYIDDPTQCNQLADMENALQIVYNQYNTQNIYIPDGMPDVYAWICANYTRNEISLPGIDHWNDAVYFYTPNR